VKSVQCPPKIKILSITLISGKFTVFRQELSMKVTRESGVVKVL
jgi:hypothetical protein